MQHAGNTLQHYSAPVRSITHHRPPAHQPSSQPGPDLDPCFLVPVLLVDPETPEGPGIVTVPQSAKRDEQGHLPSSAASTHASLAPNLDLGPCSLVVVFAFYEGGKGSLPHLLLCRSLGRGHLERSSTPPHPLSTTSLFGRWEFLPSTYSTAQSIHPASARETPSRVRPVYPRSSDLFLP